MKNTARRHHFVPQGYLAGFTDKGTRDGQLTVFDCKSRRIFQTKPKKVAVQRDFNRFDLEGHPPDMVEQALGDFEGKAISVIHKIRTNEPLPADDELSYVMNLMALLFVRKPRLRESMNKAIKHSREIIMDRLGANEGIYNHHFKEAKKNEFIPKDAELSFERFVAERNNYTIGISTTESLFYELSVFDTVLKTFGCRHWSIMTADKEAPDFITCDHPVTIASKDENGHGFGGCGTPNTEMSFPLGPRHLLIGDMEKPLPRQAIASSKNVAEINNRTINNAERHVYGRTQHIYILQGDKVIPTDLDCCQHKCSGDCPAPAESVEQHVGMSGYACS